jgi:hypothetical protein
MSSLRKTSIARIRTHIDVSITYIRSKTISTLSHHTKLLQNESEAIEGKKRIEYINVIRNAESKTGQKIK